MYEQINQRLEELHHQFEQGNVKLMRMEKETTELKETLLRIQGAIQVLEEFSGRENRQDPPDDFTGKTDEIILPIPAGGQALEDQPVNEPRD